MKTVLIALALLPLAVLISFFAYRAFALKQGKTTPWFTMLYHSAAGCTGLFLLVVLRAFFNGDFAEIERDNDGYCDRLTQVCPLPRKPNKPGPAK